MSDFKFEFIKDGASTETHLSSQPVQPALSEDEPKFVAAHEILPPLGGNPFASAILRKLTESYKYVLRALTTDEAVKLVPEAETAFSDLLPGKYEGGLKLWESAEDLARFLLTRCIGGNMAGKRVIELGCGQGLPGIVCALHGAQVCFQDLNPEVLTSVTAPNLFLNSIHTSAPHGGQPTSCTVNNDQGGHDTRYFAGDWSQIGPLLSRLGLANSFDLVISSETIYSAASMQSLLGCIKQCLAPGGSALIAAKTMYFGLDGGTFAFRQLVEKCGDATLECVSQVSEGVAREILELKLTVT